MGIRGLTSLISKRAPGAIQKVPDDDLVGKKFAIDSSILMYKFSHASKSHENAHTIGFLNRITSLLHGGILPVFVFDGVPPDEKLSTLKKRKEDKRKLYVKVEALEALLPTLTLESEIDECTRSIAHYRNQIVKVTEEQKADVAELLRVLGIPVVYSPGEAEQTCAFMQRSGIVDYCVTDDSDAFPFGALKVIKLTKLKLKKGGVDVFSLDAVLEGTGLSYASFVDMCILSGCDFCDTVPRIGPVSAFKLIAKHKSIEEAAKQNDALRAPSFRFSKARDIFKAGHQEVGSTALLELDKEGLRNFLRDKGFQSRDIQKWLNKADASRAEYHARN